MARIAGVTIPNEKQVQIALTYVYGIGPKFSKDILAAAKIEPTTRVKDLTDGEIGRISEVIAESYTVEGELQRIVTGNIKRLKDMEAIIADGGTERMSKKEALMFARELEKLNQSIGGIKDMPTLPDAIFVCDVGYHKIAITEAEKLGIPVVGIVDTNHSPAGVSYIIPGNDDSARAIRLYARSVADAVLAGRDQAVNDVVEAIKGGDDFVEVSEEGAEG